MFILASHGDYALETLKSCEIITGSLSGFEVISFKDPMSVDDVVRCYRDILKKSNEASENIAIIVDIPNGTPANAAKIFIADHPTIRLFSGLSLMLILSLATGTPIDEAIQQTIEMTGDTGKTHLKPDPKTSNEKVISKNTGNPLINVRIDSRLIHGQVATMWTRNLNATRIMVVDDQIVKSKVQKATLKTAVPAGVHLSILTIKGAAKRITSGQYNGQRVFLIVKKPQVLYQLVNSSVKLPDINVGNMSMSQGARQVAKSVAVTSDDVVIFKKLADQGITLYHQMVPNDKQEEFMPMINEKEN